MQIRASGNIKLGLIALMFVFVGAVAYSQPKDPNGAAGGTERQHAKEASFKKGNEKAIELLRRMRAEEIEALDKKLAQALVYYYDRKFAQALPIFKEVSDRVETMDIMFWIGTCAMNAGEIDLAIEKFNKMLAMDPELHRVRLELATTYFKAGRFDEARRELEQVKAASPPQAVRQNIERLLSAIEERTRNVFWNLRGSVGFLWDDNVNLGPGQRELEVSGGTLNLDDLSIQLSDEGIVTDLAGNVVYDMGERHGFMWNTSGTFFNKAYFDYSQFDFMLLDIATGPWWVARRDIVKVPFGYSYLEYGSDRLSRIIHVDPSYEHHFNPFFSLKGSYSFSDTNYYETKNSDLDNSRHLFGLGPYVYLFDRRHILSGNLGYDYSDADGDQYSYSGPVIGLSYLALLPTRTELYLGYQWFRRDYDEKPLLYDIDREDKRHTITAALSQSFYTYFFGSFAFSYIDNDSTTALYKFDQTTYTLNIGCRF